MKVLKFNFFSAIYAVLLAIIAAALIAGLNSCATEIDEVYSLQHTVNKDSISVGDTNRLNLIALKEPIDTDYIPPNPIPEDTFGVDSIVIDPECEDLLYLEPLFVSGWWYIPDYTIDSVQVCVYPHCVVVPFSEDIVGILDSLLTVYDPAYEYEVFADFPTTFCFIAKGTNDKNHYNGEVWLRPVGFHSGWGFDCVKQQFSFFNSLTADQWIEKIEQYPSVNRFNMQYTTWDSIEYIKVFDYLLECRIGRSYADLRYLPFTFPDSVYQKFEEAGWDTVLY